MRYLKSRWTSLGIQNPLETLQIIFVSLFCLECVIGGAGRIVSVGFFSIRMILFGISFVLTLPAVWKARRDFFHQRYFWVLFAFFVMLAVYAVYGYLAGNRLGFVRQDVTIFMTLLLYPGLIALLNTRDRMRWFVDIIYAGSLFMMLLTLAAHVALAFISKNAINAFNDFINSISYGGLAMFGKNFFRVYFKSQIFLQFGAMIGLYKLFTAQKRSRRILYMVLEILIVYAMILSYTRGFWLGLAVSCIVMLICCTYDWKRYLKTFGILIAGLACMFLLSYGLYGANSAFTIFEVRIGMTVSNPALVQEQIIGTTGSGKTTHDATLDSYINETNAASVDLRARTLREHFRLIAANPILGYGLGKNLDGVRTEGRTEYTYIDLYMKLGLVGFCLFMLVFCAHAGEAVAIVFRRRKARPQLLSTYLCAGYVGILVTSFLNPFLTSPMGIVLLFALILSVRSDRGEFVTL